MDPWVILGWVCAMSLAAVIATVAVVAVVGLIGGMRRNGER